MRERERERERENGYGSWGVRVEDLKEGFIYGVVPRQHEFLAHVRTWSDCVFFSLLAVLEPPVKAQGASRPSTSNIVGPSLGYNH